MAETYRQLRALAYEEAVTVLADYLPEGTRLTEMSDEAIGAWERDWLPRGLGKRGSLMTTTSHGTPSDADVPSVEVAEARSRLVRRRSQWAELPPEDKEAVFSYRGPEVVGPQMPQAVFSDVPDTTHLTAPPGTPGSAPGR